jgi:hypothetical protein
LLSERKLCYWPSAGLTRVLVLLTLQAAVDALFFFDAPNMTV